MPTPSYAFPFPVTYPEVTSAGVGPVEGLSSGYYTVPAPTGVAVYDTANIQNAVNQAGTINGGTVQLQPGAYALSSSQRADTVTNAGPTTAWTDTSITAADLGSYVIGVNIVGSGGTFGRAPKITAVTPGVGFTTDIRPGVAYSSNTAYIVSPGVCLLEGVKLVGRGGIVGGNTASNSWASTASSFGTALIDSGNGITVMTRGSGSYGSRYGLYDMVVWGSPTLGGASWSNSTGYSGKAQMGLFLSNNSWFFEASNCDFNYYAIAGAAFDGNMNNYSFFNCTFQHAGTSTATVPTGGVLGSYFTGATSASVNFFNCSAAGTFGSGLAGGPGDGGLGCAFNIWGGQYWNNLTTSWTYSGYGAVLEGLYSYGKCAIYGGWFGGPNGTGDLWLNGGSLVAENTTFTSATTNIITTYGNLSLVGCDLVVPTNGNAIAINSPGTVNWMGCTLALAPAATGTPHLYTSGPTIAQCLGIGTTQGMALGPTNYTNP